MFEVLDQCGVSWELLIISSDRNPGVLTDYCGEARQNGIKVFIAGAGMAARLPGSVAANTKYFSPVIGVALPSEEHPDALDALLSIVRSPAGCPVTCSGIGKAGLRNAAIRAVQILGAGDDEKSKKIAEKLTAYLYQNRKDPQIGYKKSQRKED